MEAVKDRATEERASGVPEGATQGAEVRARWAWSEPTVWTERMLTALEEGVKGGKWYSLIDKVYLRANLRSAFAKVAENEGAAGADRQTIEMFGKELGANLERLAEEVKDGTYRPKPVRREWIDKPGSKEKRPLGIPTVRDRVVQKALLNVLEPIFERDFAAHSYGFRPRRGCKDALRRVDELLKAGYTWVVDADLKGYFDSIPRDQLVERVIEKVSDGRVIELITHYPEARRAGRVRVWGARSGDPAGGGPEPVAFQHLSRPPGSPDGRRGDRDGALRRRLRVAVSK